MAVADKVLALLDTMTVASLMELPPARRRQFAATCRHWGELAEKSLQKPTGADAGKGVLAALDNGDRAG
jgi:hypothetical protein